MLCRFTNATMSRENEEQYDRDVVRRMSQEKQMTKRVWGLTDRRPCGSADREDERTIKNVWVMGKMTKKIREIVTNHTGTADTGVGCERNHYQDN